MIDKIKTVDEIINETGVLYVKDRIEEVVDKVDEIVDAINNLEVLVEVLNQK